MLKMLDMIAEGSNAEAGAEEAKAVDMGGNLGEGEETIQTTRRDAPRDETGKSELAPPTTAKTGTLEAAAPHLA